MVESCVWLDLIKLGSHGKLFKYDLSARRFVFLVLIVRLNHISHLRIPVLTDNYARLRGQNDIDWVIE
jgi:hypothetical protein